MAQEQVKEEATDELVTAAEPEVEAAAPEPEEAEKDTAAEKAASETEEHAEESPAKAEETEEEESGEPAASQLDTVAVESEAEPAEPAVDLPEGTAWYVIHCYSGYEFKVQRNLLNRIESMGMEDYIFDVVVPTEEEVELREGKRRTVERRIFPGYLFIEMLMTDDSWSVVRNTPGVTGFVGSGTKPTSVPQSDIDKIRHRMEEDEPRVKVSFREGEAVRIVDGPFADFMGTVDEINSDRGKVKVLVSFFGRETPVELDFLQVERG